MNPKVDKYWIQRLKQAFERDLEEMSEWNIDELLEAATVSAKQGILGDLLNDGDPTWLEIRKMVKQYVYACCEHLEKLDSTYALPEEYRAFLLSED